MAGTTERAAALFDGTLDRIVVLDGATGTELLRGATCADPASAARGASLDPRRDPPDLDALVLIDPERVARVHRAHLDAGAEVVGTDSFRTDPLTRARRRLPHDATVLAQAAARLARREADAAERRDPSRPRFVAGSMGPADPAPVADLVAAHAARAQALLEGGADLLHVESVADPVGLRAAVAGALRAFARRGARAPLLVSVVVDPLNGRTLWGATVVEAYEALGDAAPDAFGLSCGWGTEGLLEPLRALARAVPCAVHVRPSAGAPDASGRGRESPATWAAAIAAWAREGLVDLAGGCCGATPEHVHALAHAVQGIAPRRRGDEPPAEPGVR